MPQVDLRSQLLLQDFDLVVGEKKINLTYCLGRSSNQTLPDEFLPSVIQEIFTHYVWGTALGLGTSGQDNGGGGAWPRRISRTAREMFTQIDKDPTA